MKILEIKPHPRYSNFDYVKPWWCLIQLKCHTCGTRFELDPWDELLSQDSKHAAGDAEGTERYFIIVRCPSPSCQASVWRYGPLRTVGTGSYAKKWRHKRT